MATSIAASTADVKSPIAYWHGMPFDAAKALLWMREVHFAG
jgi:hypothetical protein